MPNKNQRIWFLAFSLSAVSMNPKFLLSFLGTRYKKFPPFITFATLDKRESISFSFNSNVLKLNLYSRFSFSGHFRKSLIKSPSGRLSILKINLLGCLFAIKTSMIEPILQSSFIAEKNTEDRD